MAVGALPEGHINLSDDDPEDKNRLSYLREFKSIIAMHSKMQRLDTLDAKLEAPLPESIRKASSNLASAHISEQPLECRPSLGHYFLTFHAIN
jgi:hypothetical protein